MSHDWPRRHCAHSGVSARHRCFRSGALVTVEGDYFELRLLRVALYIPAVISALTADDAPEFTSDAHSAYPWRDARSRSLRQSPLYARAAGRFGAQATDGTVVGSDGVPIDEGSPCAWCRADAPTGVVTILLTLVLAPVEVSLALWRYEHRRVGDGCPSRRWGAQGAGLALHVVNAKIAHIAASMSSSFTLFSRALAILRTLSCLVHDVVQLERFGRL
jgi:hypothetical protein